MVKIKNKGGFYEVRYAYPSSEMAKQLKRSALGCYYVCLEGNHINKPFNVMSEALEFAQSKGFVPSPYSMDVYKTGGN